MQLISVLKKEYQLKTSNGIMDKVVYKTYHSRNGSFLEREDDEDKFQILRYVDDCSNSNLMTSSQILELLNDVAIVIDETKDDYEICNHLKEVIVLCKFCIWNDGDYYIKISPWDTDGIEYPPQLPKKLRFNISSL